MLNFCDDAGIHPASTRRLKMEVYPADDYTSNDIRRMIDELIRNELVVEYKAENKEFWQVTGWKHQKIDRPTFKYPKPETIIRREIDETSPPEGKGRDVEGKGKDKTTLSGKSEKLSTGQNQDQNIGASICPEDFQPTQQTIAKCYRQGCRKHTPDDIAKFTSHYRAENKILTPDGWQEKFFGWMVNQKQFDLKGQNNGTHKQGNRQNSQSGAAILAQECSGAFEPDKNIE